MVAMKAPIGGLMAGGGTQSAADIPALLRKFASRTYIDFAPPDYGAFIGKNDEYETHLYEVARSTAEAEHALTRLMQSNRSDVKGEVEQWAKTHFEKIPPMLRVDTDASPFIDRETAKLMDRLDAIDPNLTLEQRISHWKGLVDEIVLPKTVKAESESDRQSADSDSRRDEEELNELIQQYMDNPQLIAAIGNGMPVEDVIRSMEAHEKHWQDTVTSGKEGPNAETSNPNSSLIR